MTGIAFVASVAYGAFIVFVAFVGLFFPYIVGFLRVVGFRRVFGVLGFLGVCRFLDVLGDIVVGVVVGVSIVAGVGFLLLVVGVVVEVGQRRAAQVPAHVRVVPPQAPRTLRWVGGLLPGGEGAAWLVEVGSCLAEARDKSERRRYVRSYRRNVPRLIWTSWAVRLSGSRRRELL